MATVVNNPSTNSDSAGTSGMLIGVVLVIAVLLLLWIFGMPYLNGNGTSNTQPTTIENNMQPPAEEGDTNVNVPIPDQIDVNVQNDGDQQQ